MRGHSNLDPRMLEATALSTVSQPLPIISFPLVRRCQRFAFSPSFISIAHFASFSSNLYSVHLSWSLSGCQLACLKCDQIGRFFNFLVTKFAYKSSPNILVIFGATLNNNIFM